MSRLATMPVMGQQRRGTAALVVLSWRVVKSNYRRRISAGPRLPPHETFYCFTSEPRNGLLPDLPLGLLVSLRPSPD